ncbi:hypothetical protein GCK72_015191 [Caenorhabditis remanei]|uniref:Uncharacterized protein n=1 Tax=Caenorhabditis remanei TaxID=31234 RepID=A0A6A5GVU9_CAERE|nr:hypothetical protein GCK72_015191 [Caenorhabditis remanei]KAF1758731.1 hypothetical protein GCK72_015191 [Caenorhabditis remanei]
MVDERENYSINGICRFENFADSFRNSDFPNFPIGFICGFDEWRLTLKIKEINGNSYVHPSVRSYWRSQLHSIRVRFFIAILDGDGSQRLVMGRRCHLTPRKLPAGIYLKLESLLDEGNGWLDNGALLLAFHSSYLKLTCEVECNTFCRETVECVQIAFGVKIQSKESNPIVILDMARELGLTNVIRYCERFLIEERDLDSLLFEFKLAADYKLNHYLTYLLKSFGGKNQRKLAGILKKIGVENMSLEYMKQCTKYFFDNSKTRFL